MQRQCLLILSAFLLALILELLVGCASVPDVPVCTEITPIRGYCVWTISEKEQMVDDEHLLFGRTWWDLRPEFVLVPPTSYASIKTAFIKMCKQNGNCAAKIDLWERKFNSIEDRP